MTTATLTAPILPYLDPDTVDAIRRATRRALTLAAFALQSIAAAALVWLLLAAPGLLA